MDIETLEQKLNDLESKYMFQENLLDGINKIVAEQQEVIDKLIKVVRNLEASSDDDSSPHQKPPHY